MLFICREIKSWMSDLHNNAIEPGADLPAFAEPIIGIASGADPLFEFTKDDIGSDFYWTPHEAFSFAFPSINVEPHELSVISWVLPQTENTRSAHREKKEMPSIEWSKGRHFGEKVNENLRRHVVNWFLSNLIEACAPVLLPQWGRRSSVKYGFASNWSERHAAHACGLGTFGLSDGLITPAGKAVRLGSVIVRQEYTPTPRTYTSHNEWCLFYAKGKCNGCIKRCPAGAITEKGHDKVKCKEYIRKVTAVYVEKEQLGFRVNSCGLCQTRVPCESRNPTEKR